MNELHNAPGWRVSEFEGYDYLRGDKVNTAHFDPFDGDANPEFGPDCPDCKVEMDWEDCHACDMDGYIESDADTYTDDTVIEICTVCSGDGGFWICDNCGYTVTDAELKEPQELNQREE